MSPAIGVGPSSILAGQRGVMAVAPIKAGEVIMVMGGPVVDIPTHNQIGSFGEEYGIDISEHFVNRQLDAGFDVALIPIGAYEPRWFMAPLHMNPAEAVQVHLELQAKRILGMHYGTWQLTDEGIDDPPQALAVAREQAALAPDSFAAANFGQTY